MNRLANVIIVLGIVVFMIMIAGCAQQEQSSPKKDRTIAAENIALKKKVDLLGKEIRGLKKQHEDEMDKQKKTLASCMKENEALKKKSQRNVREQVKGVLDAVIEDNTRLREENGKLKAQIKKLKTELKQESKEP